MKRRMTLAHGKCRHREHWTASGNCAFVPFHRNQLSDGENTQMPTVIINAKTAGATSDVLRQMRRLNFSHRTATDGSVATGCKKDGSCLCDYCIDEYAREGFERIAMQQQQIPSTHLPFPVPLRGSDVPIITSSAVRSALQKSKR